MGRRWWCAWLVAGTLLAACGGGGSAAAPEQLETPERYPVSSMTETYVDPSRSTDPVADIPGKPGRTFPTQITAPQGRGPFPLILFSHGSGVSDPATRYQALSQAWAAAGYVVAVPTYPLTSVFAEGTGADMVNEPADISFLITEFGRHHPGLVDDGRVAIAGHSLGAFASLATGYNRCCIDHRVKAVVSLAGAQYGPFPADQWFTAEGPHTPLLVVHGDDDRVVRIDGGRAAFTSASPPKAMLTVLGGDHTRPYGGALATTENPDRLGADARGETRLVNVTVVGFLDRYVRDDADAWDKVQKGLADELNVRLEYIP